MEKVFSVGFSPRLYNEDHRPTELIRTLLRQEWKMIEKRRQRFQLRLESQPVKRRQLVI
jgi:hypothetical protein